ncbi:MAG: methyltransferase domain-containing protein [Candidatus Eremiobacteraeota bacterium]|nr:methyltransferase domain-containing protein [Candidatus Eremiobacteraeota bacterium]
MDDPVESIHELEANLRDIERANRWLGGIAPVKSAIFSLGAKTVLDVGCASADIALELVEHAQDQCRDLCITCLDISEQMLTIAQTRTANHPALRFVQGDGADLPFADAEFDVVMCNLALHHFDPGSAVVLLREMRRVARISPLVCDLRRSVVSYAGAWTLSRLTTANRLTRHDAPLSVLRAYTPSEAEDLALRAGWHNPRVERTPFYRMIVRDEL